MQPDSGEKIALMLRRAKLRKTGPRTQILAALMDAKAPLTQEQIAETIGADAPNRVTIYRTLEIFVAADIVHKAFLQDRTWHFELAHNCTAGQCHPHFSCTNCGQTHCMTNVAVPMAKGRDGYVIHHQRVQLEGLCPACSKSA